MNPPVYGAHPETAEALYRERAHLVAHLAALYPSCIGPADDVDEPGWAIVYISGPAGQMTWHIAPRDLDLFGHVHVGAGEWDGHTTAEKYRRLDTLSAAHGRRTVSGRAAYEAYIAALGWVTAVRWDDADDAYRAAWDAAAKVARADLLAERDFRLTGLVAEIIGKVEAFAEGVQPITAADLARWHKSAEGAA
jgi:hypothetical protein